MSPTSARAPRRPRTRTRTRTRARTRPPARRRPIARLRRGTACASASAARASTHASTRTTAAIGWWGPAARTEPGCSKLSAMAEPFVLEGDDLVRVVGTSHYQEALLELAPRESDEEVRVQKIGVLVPEPGNPHDPDAIAVHIDGRLVGYLSREENRRWRDVANGGRPVAA